MVAPRSAGRGDRAPPDSAANADLISWQLRFGGGYASEVSFCRQLRPRKKHICRSAGRCHDLLIPERVRNWTNGNKNFARFSIRQNRERRTLVSALRGVKNVDFRLRSHPLW